MCDLEYGAAGGISNGRNDTKDPFVRTESVSQDWFNDSRLSFFRFKRKALAQWLELLFARSVWSLSLEIIRLMSEYRVPCGLVGIQDPICGYETILGHGGSDHSGDG